MEMARFVSGTGEDALEALAGEWGWLLRGVRGG